MYILITWLGSPELVEYEIPKSLSRIHLRSLNDNIAIYTDYSIRQGNPELIE